MAQWQQQQPSNRRAALGQHDWASAKAEAQFSCDDWFCMIEACFTVYYRRATQLADAMKLCQDDLPAYASAAVLLAVHSAISYSDAVLVGLGNTRPRGENHRAAITALKRTCSGAGIDHQGVTQLQKLLNAKTDISYGEKQVDDERVAALCIAAERFQVWAERILQRREGRLS
jgi:hypothetical protein